MAAPPPGSRWSSVSVRLWRLTTSLVHPIVVVFFLAAVFSYVSGDTVRAVYFLVIGLALAWDRASRRGFTASLAGAGADPGGGDGEVALARVEVFSADSVERRRAATGPLLAPAIVAGLAYSVVVGWLPRYSVPATIAVTALAAVAIVAAWRASAGATGEPERLDPAGLAAWAFIAVGVSAWELAALYLQPSLTTDSYAHPTLSYLANGILAAWPGRSIVIFGWLALGWYLARL